uniref:HNH endonuclease n=1 Tax=uncultured marine group II/III euryarchaeote AD1000_12_B08 TaxID=1457724 RepID=A0A075FJB0_9EURY|nr:HNH endonuclease [uncultured marine group II/III euryarchaeote AD1000_12_B08]
MKVKLVELSVKELTEGFDDKEEKGIVGYGGKLDIRPPYQREFVYKSKQRDAVIDTLTKGFPLNVMYWAVKKDGTFEIIDGQQRTISISQYVNGEFSYNGKYFHNLQDDEQKQILDYKLTIYRCNGADSEKLEWFKTINIAGEELTDQELRNAVYSGTWVTHAKTFFSKSNCVAYNIGNNYLTGSPIRQDYLETVLKWISGDEIEDYMGKNQKEAKADELWEYFQSVITWVSTTFTNYRKFMKGVNWGVLYTEFKDDKLNPKKIEAETQKLIADDDVTKKSGIYPYILTRKRKYLSIRAFSPAIKQKVYENQKGKCKNCKKKFDIEEMEGDHLKPWHEGGKTIDANCQMLCKECNRTKGGK